MNGIEIFSKKNETKSVSMVLNDVEIFQLLQVILLYLKKKRLANL